MDNGGAKKKLNFYLTSSFEPKLWYKFDIDPTTISTLTDYGSSGYNLNIINNISTPTLIKYPTTNLTNNDKTFTSGFYDNTYTTFKAFDGNFTNFNNSWVSDIVPRYLSGVPNRTFFTDYSGEYIGVDLDIPITLQYFVINSTQFNLERNPLRFRLYGANNANCKTNFTSTYWSVIYDQSTDLTAWNALEARIFTVPYNPYPFRYYALVFNKLNNTGYAQTQELELYGFQDAIMTEYPSTNYNLYITASSQYPAYEPFKAFDGNTTTFQNSWVDSGNYTNGVPNRTFFTEYAGEYLLIDLQYSIVVKFFYIYSAPSLNARCPVKFRLYGANDANCKTNFTSTYWNIILDQSTDLSWSVSELKKFFTPYNLTSYRYIALVINQVSSGTLGTFCQVQELVFFGNTTNFDIMKKYPILPLIDNTYCTGSSTLGSSYTYYKAFDNDPSTFYTCSSSKYTGGNYIGTSSINGYLGEYLCIDCQDQIRLSYITILPRYLYIGRAPRDFRIYASNDNNFYTNFSITNWTLIYDKVEISTASTYINYVIKTFNINCSTPYRYYALITNKTWSVSVDIAELNYYGYKDAVIKTIQKKIGNTTYPLQFSYNWNGYKTTSNDNSYLEYSIPTSFLTSLKNTFSISFLYYTNDVNTQQDIFHIGVSNNRVIHICVISGSVIFNVGNGVGDIFNTNYKQFTRSINVNTWYHMICMMNVVGLNTTLSIIFYGFSYSTVLSNFVPSTNWQVLSGLVMNIGKRGTDNYDLTPSFLSDFRLFNTILSQDEITAIGQGFSVWTSTTPSYIKYGVERFLDSPSYYDENGSKYIQYPEGNVGIGSTTPTEKLDVIGNIKTTNNFIGNGSLLTNVYLGDKTTDNLVEGTTNKYSPFTISVADISISKNIITTGNIETPPAIPGTGWIKIYGNNLTTTGTNTNVTLNLSTKGIGEKNLQIIYYVEN